MRREKQTDKQTNRQTDRRMEGKRHMKKPIVAFRHFAKAPPKFCAHLDRSNVRIALLSIDLLFAGALFRNEGTSS